MKTLFSIIILLFTLQSFSQESDCSKYTTIIEDEVTGKSFKSAIKNVVVSKDNGKSGFGIIISESSNTIIFSIQAVGASNCIEQNSKANILFRDGTRLEISNDNKFNCKNKFKIFFRDVFRKEKQLNELATKEIKIMRIETMNGFVQEEFTPEQSKELMNIIKCISEE